MNEIVQNIEKQVKSCQSLLSIFQDERQMYQNKGAVDVTDVMKMLERKKSVMQVFEQQQQILREVGASEGFSNEDEAKKKNLLRDLAATLEQLLVIDHENEKLMRESIGKNGRTATTRKPAVDGRQRPALLSKHPFVPGQASKPLAGKAPMARRMTRTAPAPAAPQASATAPVANSRLRQYIQANKLGSLEAKYA